MEPYLSVLEEPHRSCEQTGRYQVEKARGDDEEDLERCSVAASGTMGQQGVRCQQSMTLLVDEPANQTSSKKSADYCQREGRCRHA
jgi:hypothetical protein